MCRFLGRGVRESGVPPETHPLLNGIRFVTSEVAKFQERESGLLEVAHGADTAFDEASYVSHGPEASLRLVVLVADLPGVGVHARAVLSTHWFAMLVTHQGPNEERCVAALTAEGNCTCGFAPSARHEKYEGCASLPIP